MSNPTYTPYQGSRGPSAEQVESNNLYLQQELLNLGIKSEYKNHGYSYMDQFKVLHITLKDDVVMTVSYDRYGFCAEGEYERDEDVDQFSLEDTIDHIQVTVAYYDTLKA